MAKKKSLYSKAKKHVKGKVKEAKKSVDRLAGFMIPGFDLFKHDLNEGSILGKKKKRK